MELTLTPDTYTPSIDENGNYIDNIPIIKNGILCLCGSTKDKVYTTKKKFSTHIKTQKHQKWLIEINQHKANHYVKLTEALELVDNQKKIIAKLTNDLQQKSFECQQTITYLTQQLTDKKQPENLIDLL